MTVLDAGAARIGAHDVARSSPATRPRVMIVVGSLEVGGAQKHIYDLVRQFDRSAFGISIVVSQAGGYFYDRMRELEVPIRNLDVRSPRHLAMRLPRFLRFVREADPDVLHAFLYYPSLFACLARLLCWPRPPRLILSKRSLNLELRADRLAVHRRILMRVPDAITAVSAPVRDRCLELGASPDRVTVIENGIEWIEAPPAGRLRERLGLPSGTPLIGAVGSLTVRKRHRQLLHAMAQLLEERPDAHLVLMGEGNLRAELEAEARRLAIDGRVHMPGMLVPAISYVRDLSLFVLPSSEEGMSNALLEYMSAGRAVIATDVGANAELVRHGKDGLIVPPGDPDSVTRAIGELLANPMRAAGYGASARRRVEAEFSRDAMRRRFEEFFSNLIRE